MVLGSGEIVQANNVTNSDLFTALKGSQNNLGIVTRFDIVAFPQGDLWGGTAIYDNTTIPAQLKAFVDFTNNIEKDPYGSLIFDWVYIPSVQKTVILENLYEYTGKFANNQSSFPPAFKAFSNTSAIGPPLKNTLRLANLSSLTGELNSPANVRYVFRSVSSDTNPNTHSNLYATLTFTNDLKILEDVTKIIDEEFNFYKKDPFYYYASVQFQPLPRIFTQHSIERGGNVLGLDRYTDNNVCRFFEFDAVRLHPANARLQFSFSTWPGTDRSWTRVSAAWRIM